MFAIWIGGAFLLGLVARRFGLPPLVGFLGAGFLLNGLGVEGTPLLHEIADLGVLLLLFSVGLKLRFQSLVRAEVWVVAILHLAIAVGIAQSLFVARLGYPLPISLLLAAAFGFSSTVLAAKMLEEKHELRAFHGRVAVGVLIMQDLVAVSLLAVIGNREVSWYAAFLLLLPLVRPVVHGLLKYLGHDELIVLFGALLAVGVGGYGFELLGLSPELGALVLGVMLAGHPRSVELGNALWGMKEFFLVAFFLNIGLAGLPTQDLTMIALVTAALIPAKLLLFFLLFVAFGLGARTAFLAGLSLATYSEFGLIVIQAAVDQGALGREWLVTAALAVAISFVLLAPLNRASHEIYDRLEDFLRFFERQRRHPDDEPLSIGSAELVVVGMGRVGTGAYDHLRELGHKVVGLDNDFGKVERHLHEGRRVVYADAEDPGLWYRLKLDRVRAIMLAVPDVEAKVIASQQLRRRRFKGLISATYAYPDEEGRILSAGCDVTYNNFTEAGVGLALNSCEAIARREAQVA